MDNAARLSSLEDTRERERGDALDVEGERVICANCGVEAVPLHMGCKLCEDCCDCRPYGT
jgi:hypothetical protein